MGLNAYKKGSSSPRLPFFRHVVPKRPKNRTSVKSDTQALIAAFSKLYPSPGTELKFQGEYELVVSVTLSAQCTDKKVNEVTPSLFKRYPGFNALSEARVSDVENIVRPINYYRTKAANIIRMAKSVTEEFGGRLPLSHSELITLSGVGNKTANVVLSELKIVPTFPVDTHVFRVSRRLGLARGKNVGLVEYELKSVFEPTLWNPMHHWLILHGRRVCKAPFPDCPNCILSKGICPKIGVVKIKKGAPLKKKTPSSA